jgi:tetratricopeptide (TPR) repeat protein
MSCFAAVAALAIAAAPPADVEKAGKSFDSAKRLYKQARYADALAKFEEAYRIKPHPVILFNIGKCYEHLGDIPKALRNYRDYLRLEPDAKDRQTVSDAIANLERRMEDQGVQQLVVNSDPTGARVTVDDRSLGNAPASAELAPGNHQVSLSLEGYEPVQRSFVMPSNKSMELSFALKASAPAPEAREQPPAFSPPPLVLTPPTAVPGIEHQLTPAPQAGPRRWSYVAAVLGVVAGGAGVGMGLASRSATNDLRSQVHSGAEAQQLADKSTRLATGANIAYGGAATAAVAALVLFILEPRLQTGGSAPSGGDR